MRLPLFCLSALLGAFAFTSPCASAGVLTVPAPYPTIQSAIDAAAPGDTILVNGGTYDPIVIDKPLTIIGTAPTIIDNTEGFPFLAPFISPAIRLAGPGNGTVVLSGIDTQGTADGSFYSASAGGIEGGGFAQLHIHGCTIRPAEWVDITGLAIGEAAIDVTVPYVLITRSTVTGGRTEIDQCDFFGPLPPSGAGVRAPAAKVVSLASRIEGGPGGDLCYGLGNCPTLGPALGAQGGTGVIAACLYAQDSYPNMYVRGGAGGDVYCGVTLLGAQLPGPDRAVNQYKQLALFLTYDMQAEIHPGGTLDLELAPFFVWGGTPQYLVVGFPAPPVDLGYDGVLFMDPGTLRLTGTSQPGGPLSLGIPNDPSLVGISIALQFWSPQTRLTDPYITVIEP